MMELLRNCGHGSEIATYLRSDNNRPTVIAKATIDPNGIVNLGNELTGWSWYQARRYPTRRDPICRIEQNNPSYRRITIDYIAGRRPDLLRGIEANADVLMQVVEHYCAVWPTNDIAPIHGDLCLDNIIINTDGVHIIDWEHFNAGGGPWGFDAIYLLFDTLYFGMLDYRPVRNGEIQLIAEGLRRLNAAKHLRGEFLAQPLAFTRHFVQSNTAYWGAQLDAFKMKLPGISFGDAQIADIDRRVSAEIDIFSTGGSRV